MNFKDHPETIGEIRANKSQNAKDWSPRDALIELLRNIDSGEIAVESLVIVYAHRDDGQKRFGYSVATPNILESLGLLTRGVHKVQE